MILYHGSDKIIEKPIFGYGKTTNDYGSGFYMTKDIELAKEWASVESNKDSYINKYELDLEGLNILDLDKVDNKVLTWMALLVKHREFNIKYAIAKESKEFLIKNFLIDDIDKYDLIKGYRADDCYFMFAKSFLYNALTIEKVGNALMLGKLGTQYVLKSKRAFNKIKYIGSEKVDNELYYYKRLLRNQKAAYEYDEIISKEDDGGQYIAEIIKDYKKEKKI